MSCLQNEIILENIYEELAEEFPTLTQDELESLTYQKFEDLCQQVLIFSTLIILSKLTTMPRTIDLYDVFTPDELDQVTNIYLEAFARLKGIEPEVFEIQTNIIIED